MKDKFLKLKQSFEDVIQSGEKNESPQQPLESSIVKRENVIPFRIPINVGDGVEWHAPVKVAGAIIHSKQYGIVAEIHEDSLIVHQEAKRIVPIDGVTKVYRQK